MSWKPPIARPLQESREEWQKKILPKGVTFATELEACLSVASSTNAGSEDSSSVSAREVAGYQRSGLRVPQRFLENGHTEAAQKVSCRRAKSNSEESQSDGEIRYSSADSSLFEDCDRGSQRGHSSDPEPEIAGSGSGSSEHFNNMSEPSSGEETRIEALAANLEHPSFGSAMHAEGDCHPCCFFQFTECLLGAHCNHCHYPHQVKQRRKTKDKKAARASSGKSKAGDGSSSKAVDDHHNG